MTTLNSFLLNAVAGPRPLTAPARFAGLEECIGRLTLLFAFQRKLLLAEGGWLPRVPYWDAKLMIGEHILCDAQHAEMILKRLHELKASSAEHQQPAGLDELMRDLTCARNGDEWLRGLYGRIKPWFVDKLRRYLASSDPVMDTPTREAMDRIIAEQQRQIAWFGQFQPEFSPWEQPDTSTWCDYLGKVLAGVVVDDGMRRNAKLRVTRPAGCVDMEGDAPLRRDATFRMVNPAEGLPEESTFDEKRVMVFFHHVQEMQFAESLGAILYGTREMPWAFHFDLARHLADEVRHSRMGQERLAQLGVNLSRVPMFDVHYQFRSQLHPVERFALMTLVIEAGAFASKRANVELFEKNGDEVSVLYESYDIRDELLHTNLGHLWVPIMLRVYHDSRTMTELIEHCRGLQA